MAIDGNTIRRAQASPQQSRPIRSRRTDHSALRQLSSMREQRRRDERAYQEDEKRRKEQYLAKLSQVGAMPTKYQRAYDESYANLFANASEMTPQQIQQAVWETNRIGGIGETIQNKRIQLYEDERNGNVILKEDFEGIWDDNGQPIDVNAEGSRDAISMQEQAIFAPKEQEIVDSLNKTIEGMLDNNSELSARIVDGIREAKTTGTLSEGEAKEALRSAVHASRAYDYFEELAKREGHQGDVIDFVFNRWKDQLDLKDVEVKAMNVPQPKEDKKKGFRWGNGYWTDDVYRYTKGGGSEDTDNAAVLSSPQTDAEGNTITETIGFDKVVLSRDNRDIPIRSVDFYNEDGDLVTGRMREIRKYPNGYQEVVISTKEGDTEKLPYEKNREVLLGEYNLDRGKIQTMLGEEDETTSTESGLTDGQKKAMKAFGQDKFDLLSPELQKKFLEKYK